MHISQEISVKQYEILLIPATIISSVLLVGSCLFFKRLKNIKRNGSSSSTEQEKNKDAGSQVKGLSNTAFTVSTGDLYKNDEATLVYDYATNDRVLKKGLRWPIPYDSGKNKVVETSPAYIDITDDSSSPFYFTLERNVDSQKADEDTYVIAIPQNLYDKPENGFAQSTRGKSVEVNGAQSGQFYHTLEECDIENETSLSEILEVKNSENAAGITSFTESKRIFDNVMDGKNDLGSEVNIVDETRDVKKLENVEELNRDTYVINVPCEVQANSKDEVIKGTGMIVSSRFGKTAISLVTASGESEENREYFEDDVSPENMPKDLDIRERSGQSEYVISAANAFQIGDIDSNPGLHNSGSYVDDDIYEDWEDNIIGRSKNVEECDDRIYLNESFHVDETNDENLGSGNCLYVNMTEYRHSLAVNS